MARRQQPAKYSVASLESAGRKGVLAVIQGPGIGRDGVRYWLADASDAQALVQNLNLSYSYSNAASALVRIRKLEQRSAHRPSLVAGAS
jgi:hypothetical protein